MNLRHSIKKYLPWPLHYLYRKLYYVPKDLPAALGFIFHTTASPTSFGQRLALVYKFYLISYKVDCPHTEHELLAIAKRILNLGPDVKGVVVEAGAYHGGSTSKLSLVARLCNRELLVFDSFEGMPQNTEPGGRSIFGREHHFPKGSHSVALEIVKTNISRYGDISRCRFYPGWLNETLPRVHEPVAAACMNVDLAQSTKDCLQYLYPNMAHGGIIFSQDGHFPWIIDLLGNRAFWKETIGIEPPAMEGLGASKLVPIYIR